MFVPALVSSIALLLAASSSSARAAQPQASVACSDWQGCREMALEAAARHDYETFHDLAWRTVQTGPPKDPALMLLLARAQCLSGRPHDALIMLQRIAETGVASDALTSGDFRRTRALPGWPDVKALIERAQHADVDTPAPIPAASDAAPSTPAATAPTAAAEPAPAASPAPAPSPAPLPPPPPAASIMTVKPEPIEQAVQVSAARFAAGGLAYDAVSRRFVIGDLHASKLMVVSEGSNHAVDLVRADSAGFRDLAAVEIDSRRGDLWVATGAASNTDWTLHKVQLVSGRPLKAFAVDSDDEPMKLVDLAVTPGGSVLALDGAGGRLLALRPAATRLKLAARLDVQDATSVAATSDENIVYVANGAGISRVDLKTGDADLVAAPAGIDLGRVGRIRSHRNTLVAVQIDASGSRSIVRFDLNRSGRAVVAATIIDVSIPSAAGPTFATISGDDLCYLVAEGGSSGEAADFVIRRIRLR